MDWSNESYVRVYTRDTTTWKLMDWRARTVLLHLFRKVDRAGVLDVGSDGVFGLAAVLELPLEVVEPGIAQLVTARGNAEPTVVSTGTSYVLPRFLEAQEASQSDRQRKRASRDRRRTEALTQSRNVTASGTLVTSGHENVGGVTLSSAVLSSAPEDLPPARAIPPSTKPVLDASTREEREALRKELLLDLNEARQAVAAEIGVEHRPLLAQDPGERALALLITQSSGDHERIAADARHAIAVASAEAIRDRSLRWLTGVIFEERNYRRLVGATVSEARRSRAGPRREERPKTLRYTSKDPEPDLSYDPNKS